MRRKPPYFVTSELMASTTVRKHCAR